MSIRWLLALENENSAIITTSFNTYKWPEKTLIDLYRMHTYDIGNLKSRNIMLIAKHTVKTSASPADIWNIWQNVTEWNTWDHGTEFSSIEGAFEVKTTGRLKPKGGPLVKIILTQVEPLKMFTCESKLFLSKIIVSHYLRKSDDKTEVTHQIEMTGFLKFLFAFLIGRQMKKNLPTDLLSLIKKAESLDFHQ